ncbi:purine-binding chemotaxis protein CheW [Leptospira koniambonensis]|uniref:Purine-binding chemotaxis protein CheW n=1 Tax=Leptospira koniambonensis TaxID=2484950 RepID=A0A4R9J487_9LEPT|nr:chemotaxis protein CheW [Leptospira koniambonensis]TGL32582.1 purine-binding chemotaxis protein CheW [Leptospira koniambonensis]
MRAMQINANQYLTFRLGQDEFGVEILKVREILEFREPTRVPRTSKFISGVINLRGNVVSVMDLARLFQNRDIEATKRTCIIILEIPNDDKNIIAGILVDSVNEVATIPPELVDPVPAFGASIQTDFIRGIGKLENRVVILLNPSMMLDFNEVVSLYGKTDEEIEDLTLVGPS